MIAISAGLVLISDNKILLCHPTGQKWWGTYSIPKGHVEEDEEILDAAIRETREEVGVLIDIKKNRIFDEGYIDYKNDNGEVYKRVYFFVIKLIEPIEIDLDKLDKKEVDWAGFKTKKEAEKRIFWRFKSLLEYLNE